MKVRGIVMVVVLLVLLASVVVSAGCNTWKGAGKDVEKTGESMQGQ